MKLYYLCPDYSGNAGGIRVIYRHVDLLRSNGYDAFVVHERQGFRDTSFENETPVIAWSRHRHSVHDSLASRATRSIRRNLRRMPPPASPLHLREPPCFAIEPTDVVVIPEVFGPDLARIAPGVPKVIFVQNPYAAFFGYPADPRSVVPPYRHPEVVASFLTSEDTRRVMEYTFPGLKGYRVRWSLNRTHYHLELNKVEQIAYMPRKGADDARQVLAMLASRGSLADFRIRPIVNLDETGVAACMRESLIFLSLGQHEGLPLPPAEAMACGAIVVGYDGFGGREYMLPEFAFPVPAGDRMEFARTLERVIALQREKPDELRDRATRASAFVTELLSRSREEQELLGAWDEILGALGHPVSRSQR